VKKIAERAVEAARLAGADYADARAVVFRRQFVYVEDLSPKIIADEYDAGVGVRVLKAGAWGFASFSRLDARSAERAAREAAAVAEASALAAGGVPVRLAAEPVQRGRFATPVRIDPFSVPLADKTALLLRANEIMLGVKGVAKTRAQATAISRLQAFASSEGSLVETEITTVEAGYRATAVGGNDSQERGYGDWPLNKGWEHILDQKLEENAGRTAEEAVAKLSAALPEEGRTDLLLDPGNLSLTVHESAGHASELDRALGYEANYAGTSFLTPDKRGTFRYGSPAVNLTADNTLPGGLATTGWDDEGVACQRWDVVRNGIFVNYSTTREVAGLAGYARSFGSGRADGYVSLPINRIPNLCLMPGEADVSPEEMAAGIDAGIWIEGHGSWSIDQRRLNFQFGGDMFYEIRHGKKGRLLRDVLYQSITPDFWGAVDVVSGPRFWEPRGFTNCGKGEPPQSAQMTNGAPWARVRGINVLRGKR
jgi:TldD protein